MLKFSKRDINSILRKNSLVLNKNYPSFRPPPSRPPFASKHVEVGRKEIILVRVSGDTMGKAFLLGGFNIWYVCTCKWRRRNIWAKYE